MGARLGANLGLFFVWLVVRLIMVVWQSPIGIYQVSLPQGIDVHEKGDLSWFVCEKWGCLHVSDCVCTPLHRLCNDSFKSLGLYVQWYGCFCIGSFAIFNPLNDLSVQDFALTIRYQKFENFGIITASLQNFRNLVRFMQEKRYSFLVKWVT